MVTDADELWGESATGLIEDVDDNDAGRSDVKPDVANRFQEHSIHPLTAMVWNLRLQRILSVTYGKVHSNCCKAAQRHTPTAHHWNDR